MADWKEALAGCWNSVAVQLPALQKLGSGALDWLGGLGGGAGSEATAIFTVNVRSLRVVRQLGEGGYSFVYLVAATAASGGAASGQGGQGQGSQHYALKRVLCGGAEALAEARQEVAVMRRLRHPCLLPLLDAEVQQQPQQQQQQQSLSDGGGRHAVLMLFPVYDGGNLWDHVQQQRHADHALAAARDGDAARRRQVQQLERVREVLEVFLQVCAALHSMHSMEPPLAHRDVKPQNVLLRRRQQSGGGQAGGSRADGYGPVSALPPLEEQQRQGREGQQQQQQQQWNVGEWKTPEGDAGGADGATVATTAAVIAVVEEEGDKSLQPQQQQQQQQQPDEQWWQQRLGAWRQRGLEAVLMDFGSTRAQPVVVRNRTEAMAAQEDAERQCSAPYRAPELWDVPSSCTLNERVDVWSLGCLLYYQLCGQSPFERAAGEAGGSLMLAVVNGRLSWPVDVLPGCPTLLKQLVGACLDPDPAARPHVGQVAVQADQILCSLR